MMLYDDLEGGVEGSGEVQQGGDRYLPIYLYNYLCCCMAQTKKALQSKFTHETNLHIHQLKYKNKKVMLQSKSEYL